MANVEWTVPATVAADHPCLAGHFPGRPLVPAVLLMDLAAAAVTARFPDLRLAAIGNAKFLRPVLPDVPMTLQLSIDPDRHQARFRCTLTEGDAALGELSFTLRNAGP